MRSATEKWSFIGIFAAIQVVATIMPYSVAIGAEGTISIGLITAPLIGILLGPYAGTIAVGIGSLLGIWVSPLSGIMGIFTPLATISGAFVAGAIRSGKGLYVPLIYFAGVIGFLFSPIGSLAYSYLWLHIVTLYLLILLVSPTVTDFFKTTFDKAEDSYRLVIAVAFTCFFAVMTDHIVGSTIAAFYFNIVYNMAPNVLASIFIGVALVYPIERIIATVILTFVVIGVLKAIQQFVSLDRTGVHELES
ncbi:MAG: hypothetical protein K9W43_02800 [Candidatus Thorarchaeota archaeon]|nr:hypothetical protein [Candidatus Thorarchaeota archaeon]